jgi:hypothetical protein
MESNNAWHYTRLNDSSYEDAIAALKKESEWEPPFLVRLLI